MALLAGADQDRVRDDSGLDAWALQAVINLLSTKQEIQYVSLSLDTVLYDVSRSVAAYCISRRDVAIHMRVKQNIKQHVSVSQTPAKQAKHDSSILFERHIF